MCFSDRIKSHMRLAIEAYAIRKGTGYLECQNQMTSPIISKQISIQIENA
jgi:hypothetical protein